MNTDDPFINGNEVAPRPHSQIEEDHIATSQHSSTVRKYSKDKTSSTSELEKQKETKKSQSTLVATHDYGLPSPPDSMLSSRPPKGQDILGTQSPLQTPTKVPVSENRASPTLDLSSSSSESLENLVVSNTIGEDQAEATSLPPKFPSLPSSLDNFDQDPISARTLESPISIGVLSTRDRVDHESTIMASSSTSAPVGSELTLEGLTQKSLPVLDATSVLQTGDLLLASEKSNREPSPASPTPRNEASSSTKDKSSAASSKSVPMSKFESESEVALTSSGSDTTSKFSSPGLAPQMTSTLLNCFTSDQEKGQSEGEDEKDEISSHETTASLSSIDNVEGMIGGSAVEEPIAFSKSNLVIDVDKTHDVSESLTITPLKPHARQFEGLLTPDASPEPHQIVTTTPVAVDGISDKSKQSKSHTNEDARSLQDLEMGEATSEPLEFGHEEAPEIFDSTPRTPKIPTESYEREAENLPTSEATPEPPENLENLISLVSEQHTSGVETAQRDKPFQVEKEEEENGLTTPNAASEPSQSYDEEEFRYASQDSIEASTKMSESDLTNEKPASTTYENDATSTALPELPKSDKHYVLPVGEDCASDKAESKLPEPDQETFSISKECEANSKTECEQRTPLNEAFSVIVEDSNHFLNAMEPVNDSLPQRVESFGHALIDPSERRYKTRFSEHQAQVLLATPHSLKDINTFSDIEIDIQPFAAITPPKVSIERTVSTRHEESSPTPSINGEYVLPGEYLEWETGRGMPKQRRRQRFRQEALRVLRESITTVSETVRWETRRRSSAMPRG